VERVLKDDCYRFGNQKQKSSCDCSRRFREADDERFMPTSKALERFVRSDYPHQMQALATLVTMPPGPEAHQPTPRAPIKASLPIVYGTGRKLRIGPCLDANICLYKLSKLFRCGRGMLQIAAMAGQNGTYKDLGPQPKLLPWPAMEGTKKDRWKDPRHGVVATAFPVPSQEAKARCLRFLDEAGAEMAKKREKAEMYIPYDIKKKTPSLHDYTKLQLYDDEALRVLFPNFRCNDDSSADSSADKIRNLGHGCHGEFLKDSVKCPKFLKDVRNETVEEIKRIPAFVSKCISCSPEIVAVGKVEQLIEELKQRMEKAEETLAAAMKQIGENINNLVPGLITKIQSAKAMKGIVDKSWDRLGTNKVNELTSNIQEAEKQKTIALQAFVFDLEKEFPNVFTGMLNAASFHRQVLDQVRLAQSSFAHSLA